MTWLALERDGTRLAAYDYGGRGREVVLLIHGLAGHAREWDDTAAWLKASKRVIALDQRGHGRSERQPSDMSRDAFASDVVAWMDRLSLDKAVLVGQSLGGHTAFLTAAWHPSRVDRLIVAEASPEPDPTSIDVVRSWLEAWPTPFSSREEAIEYFGGDSLWADAWVNGLEQREGGLFPAFEIDTLVDALSEAEKRPFWDEWGQVECRTLVVRAKRGLDERIAQRMASGAHVQLVTVTDAGHDVHLEQPDAWRDVLSKFLRSN
jgi:pimeloyl-ACP methyl ester carboxylesterase